MDLRVPLVALLAASVALAGCTSDDDGGDAQPLLFLDEGLNTSHPAFDFGVTGALPEAVDGVGRMVMDDGTVAWYNPVHAGLPSPIAGLEELTAVPEADTAGGIAVFGPLAFLGGRSSGPLYVVDIVDPANPQIAGIAPDVPVRDADTILFPDGRLVVITTAGGLEIFATDVTDPANPFLIGSFTTSGSNHNIAVVPGTPIVYNSGMDIVDFSDPAKPVELGSFPSEANRGCHDITFYLDRADDKYRAYCAGYEYTQIWDIADPAAPELVSEVPFPRIPEMTGTEGVVPSNEQTGLPATFSHLALVNHDASVLIVGDETGGGALNGCDFYTGLGGMANSGPLGNLWFYDLADETAPELRGRLSPSFTDALGAPSIPNPDALPFSALDALQSCTAHFGRVIEDTDFLVMGFYAAGVLLVDFSDLDTPVITDRLDQNGSIWDVQVHQGYLFTGDMVRGMDVLKLA
ncbi:MAG: LVIVD repeat-containing protein [Thermoplasmatota archaeon]